MTRKSILFVCPYPRDKAPSQRLKFEQYFDFLESENLTLHQTSFQSAEMWNIVYQEGHLVSKLRYTLQGYLMRFFWLFKLPFYDVVYIHLWVTPFGPPIFEWLYRKLAKNIIYDIDDLVFMENASKANAWISRIKGKSKPIYLMKVADTIITTTPYLVNFCHQWNRKVYAIPPTLNEQVIFPNANKKEPILTLGWLGSHTTEKYLDIVRPALELFAKEMDIRLILLGAKNFRCKGAEVIMHPWKPELELEILHQLDIALYPLEEEVWSQGKFGGKLIQYFAAGIPCIASDVNDSNRLVISDKVNGLLVRNTTEQWLHALRILAKDSALRENIGAQARKDFLEKYSVQAHKNSYLHILDAVVSESR